MNPAEPQLPPISVRGCFFHILYRWRSLLAAAIIGALLFGGFAVLKNRGLLSSPSAVPTETKTESETEPRAQTDLAAGLYVSLLDAAEVYGTHSPLMRLDPYREWQAAASYAVKTDLSPETTAAIAMGYGAALPGALDREKLSALYGEEAAPYAAELFSIRPVPGSTVVTLLVIGDSKDSAERGLGILEEAVQRFSASTAQRLGAHTLEKLSSGTVQAADPETVARQRTLAEAVAGDRKALENIVSAAGPSADQPARKSPVKYALIGLALGVLALALIYAVRFMVSDRLQNADLFMAPLGLTVYGVLPHSRARRPGKGLDAWIERWEFGKNGQDRDAVIAGLCALLEKRPERRILLAGTLPAEKLRPLAEAVKTRLAEKKDIQLAPDLLKNDRAVAEAVGADAVLLVEERFVSASREVLRAAEVLKIGGAPVVGAVLI